MRIFYSILQKPILHKTFEFAFHLKDCNHEGPLFSICQGTSYIPPPYFACQSLLDPRSKLFRACLHVCIYLKVVRPLLSRFRAVLLHIQLALSTTVGFSAKILFIVWGNQLRPVRILRIHKLRISESSFLRNSLWT